MTTPTTTDNWVLDLAFEVALEYHTPEQLQRKYDLTADQYNAVLQTPRFLAAVDTAQRTIDEDGTQFKLLARRLSTVLLPKLAEVANDQYAKDADRINAIKEVARLAGYGKEEAASGSNTGFSVTINVGGTEPQTIDVTPEADE